MKRILIWSTSLLIVCFSLLSFKSYNGFEISKQVEVFVSFFMKLNQNYVDKTNPAELMDTAINAITNELDPYTKFWTEQDIEASKIRNSGQYLVLEPLYILKKINFLLPNLIRVFLQTKVV